MRRLADIDRDREANLAVAREKYGPTLRARMDALIAAYGLWQARGGNPDVILAIPWLGMDTLTAYLGVEPPEPIPPPANPAAAAELYLLREDRDPEAAAIIDALISRRRRARKPSPILLVIADEEEDPG